MLVLVVLLAKAISLFRADTRGGKLFVTSFLFAPWLSVDSWERRQRRLSSHDKWTIFFKSLAPVVLMVLCYLFVVPVYRGVSWWLQAYLAIIPFWLLLEAIGGVSRICWLSFGELVPSIHHSPWGAANLAEFWGRRWNRLFGDWLNQVVFIPWRRKPRLAMGGTFFVSGLIHEVVVSLPMNIVYGESVWGWLTGYFIIQYLGCLAERRLQLGTFGQKIILWGTVLLPLPLVLNRATLLIFHLGG